MHNNPKERGQALIILVLAIVALAGLAGLVVDAGNLFFDRRNAQNAADSAALAAALTRVRGTSGQSLSGAALTSAAHNGYDNNGTTNVVEVHHPPIDGPYKNNAEYVQVVIVSHVKTYFAGLLGWKQLTNRVQAVSRTKTPEVREILDGQAVISLAPNSDCHNKISFWLHEEGTLDITGGGVFVNSKNNDCAFIQQGSGSIRIRDGHMINVVGAASIQKPQLLTPGVSVGAGPISYPPPFFMPKFGCGGEAVVSEDGTSMTAGSWNDAFPPPGVTHLEAGVYCLSDGMNIVDDLDGSNVVFKIDEGDVHWSGTAKITLTAPSKGDQKGLLLFVPMKNANKVALNAGEDSNIRGTILAPASEVIISGNESKAGFKSQIIGYTINVKGDSNVIINYQDDQNYNTLTMPEVQLSE
jgi:Flp pilus assembly protein TadG